MFRLDDPDAARELAELYWRTFYNGEGIIREDVSKVEAMRAVLDAIEQPRLPTRSEVEALESALRTICDVLHDRLMPGRPPRWLTPEEGMILAIAVEALGATEDPEPEVDPAQALLNLLREARDELNRWGHGDFHYGETAQEGSVVAMVRKIDDVLASGRVQVTPQ